MYSDVDFIVIPTTVSVTLPVAQTTFTFGDHEVVSTKDDEVIQVGDYIPGEYNWSFESKEQIVPLQGDGVYSVSSHDTNKDEVDVDWDFKTLYVDSDVEDAIVYVNGVSTKKKVSELSEVYPAQLDASVKLQAVTKNKDGKEVKSAEVAADSDSIYLPFEHVQKEEQVNSQISEVEQFYKNFRSDYEEAIYYADFDYIDEYFKPGSKIRNDYAKFVTDHSTIPGYQYEFLLNDITSVTPDSSGAFVLLSYEKFNYSSYEDSRLRYDRKKKYVISQSNNYFYIDAIDDLDTKKTKY